MNDNMREGLNRMVYSSKFWKSIIASVLAFIPWVFTVTDKNLDRTQKKEASTTLVMILAGIWSVDIAGTALEDYGAKKNPANPSNPNTQTITEQSSVSATLQKNGGSPSSSTIPSSTIPRSTLPTGGSP